MARGGPDYAPYKPIAIQGTGYDNLCAVWQVNVPAGGWSSMLYPAVPAGHEYYISSIIASSEVTGVMQRVSFTVNAVARFDSFFYGQAHWDFGDRYKIVPVDILSIYLYNSDAVIHTLLFVLAIMDVTMNP